MKKSLKREVPPSPLKVEAIAPETKEINLERRRGMGVLGTHLQDVAFANTGFFIGNLSLDIGESYLSHITLAI